MLNDKHASFNVLHIMVLIIYYFSRDIVYGRASKVFLTSDLVGQTYLGYLVPNRLQLFLVRLEKTNKQQQIIFGMITSIAAKDAVNLSVSTLDSFYNNIT